MKAFIATLGLIAALSLGFGAAPARACGPEDAQGCAPPPAAAYGAPTVVYQQAPPPPAVVYQPAPTYIIPTQVTWGAPVWMGPGRQCRSYSQWAMVNGAMQPVYGVACLEGVGWRYVQPYRGAWHVDVVFDRGIHHGYHDHGHHH